jgi:hypothetical protein
LVNHNHKCHHYNSLQAWLAVLHLLLLALHLLLLALHLQHSDPLLQLLPATWLLFQLLDKLAAICEHNVNCVKSC